MSDVLEGVLADLADETHQLRAAVAKTDAWHAPTPAAGWTVATQIGHLLWTDEVATLAAHADTVEGKQAWDAVVLQAIEDPTGFVDTSAHEIAELAPAELLGRWDAAHARLVEALRAQPAGARMPWFGPPMSPTSMATARFMETWAHGLDVYDALVSAGSTNGGRSTNGGSSANGGRSTDDVPAPTDRIRHVAHLGVRTRDYSFVNNELEPPAEEFRIELTAPSGATWAWGPEDPGGTAQRVSGTAYDFCRLVTQRIHRDDTDLVATGADAEQWLGLAQCFAGPPGGGRAAKGASA